MAAGYFHQFQKTLVRECVMLHAKVPIGATGAVGTLAKLANLGIYSVTRTSAGLYVITLGNLSTSSVAKYAFLLGVDARTLFNGITAAPIMNIVSETVATTGQITLQYSSGGVATDPDSGSILYLNIFLKNSGVQ